VPTGLPDVAKGRGSSPIRCTAAATGSGCDVSADDRVFPAEHAQDAVRIRARQA